ncbi:MAG: sensor domain-containing diguanylate cyclase, partial [Gemmatimonadota bacterium]
RGIAGSPAVLWLRDGDRLRALARAGASSVRMGDDRALPASLASSFPGEPAGIWRTLPELGDPALPVRRTPEETVRPHEPAETAVPIGIEDGQVMVPLALGDRLVGVIALETEEELGADRLRVLRRMAAFAASALENARLHAEVRRLSLTDPLVQLPNRRQLDLFLRKEFEAAHRGRQLCFALYDLDHFKDFNDTHGHRAGDIALIRFAEVLQHETRAMNLAARYGGEEFATVLSDTGRAGGRAHAERVRRRAEQVFAGRLTVSAGVAVYSPGMKSPIELVVAADDALYRAKTSGRNRVHVAGE